MEQRLADGLDELGLPQDLAEPLFDYVELLTKWNKTYNLTAVRDPEEMVTLHLLDSLTAIPYLAGASVLDVGTGAGLPGIPLAIACADKSFTLLDTNGKKTRFVEHAARKLGLGNVTVVQSRIETFEPANESKIGFDTITSRAFSSLEDFAGACRGLLADGGRLLAMKGKLQSEEISVLNEAQWSITSEQVSVPGLEAERHMIILTSK